MIRVADHGLVHLDFPLGLRVQRCMGKRSMRQAHGEIQHHGFMFVSFHEVHEVIHEDIGCEFSFVGFAVRVGVDVGVPVSFAAGRIMSFVARPHAGFVEAVLFHGVGLNAEIVDLPLSDGAGRVTGGFQDAGKGVIVVPIEMTTGSEARYVPMIDPAMPEGVLAGQEGHAGGGALRHGVGVGKPHAPFGKVIDVRGFYFLPAVTTEPLRSQIVNHDEKDVGLLNIGAVTHRM